jgi:hypothetical protein
MYSLLCAVFYPPTTFTRQELATIQRSSIHVLLSAVGFNRNMLLAVVFRPASFGGIGLLCGIHTSNKAASRYLNYLRTRFSYADDKIQLFCEGLFKHVVVIVLLLELTKAHSPPTSRGKH